MFVMMAWGCSATMLRGLFKRVLIDSCYPMRVLVTAVELLSMGNGASLRARSGACLLYCFRS